MNPYHVEDSGETVDRGPETDEPDNDLVLWLHKATRQQASAISAALIRRGFQPITFHEEDFEDTFPLRSLRVEILGRMALEYAAAMGPVIVVSDLRDEPKALTGTRRYVNAAACFLDFEPSSDLPAAVMAKLDGEGYL